MASEPQRSGGSERDGDRPHERLKNEAFAGCVPAASWSSSSPRRPDPICHPSLFHACDGAATANGQKNQRFVGCVPAAYSQFHLKTRSGFRDRGIARVFVDRRKRPAKPPSCQSKIIFQPSVAAPFKPSRRIKLNQFSLILCYRYSIVLKKSAIPLRQTP